MYLEDMNSLTVLNLLYQHYLCNLEFKISKSMVEN